MIKVKENCGPEDSLCKTPSCKRAMLHVLCFVVLYCCPSICVGGLVFCVLSWGVGRCGTAPRAPEYTRDYTQLLSRWDDTEDGSVSAAGLPAMRECLGGADTYRQIFTVLGLQLLDSSRPRFL